MQTRKKLRDVVVVIAVLALIGICVAVFHRQHISNGGVEFNYKDF